MPLDYTSNEAVGRLKYTRYHKEDTGFIIASFSNGGQEFWALGNILKPAEGMKYKLRGEWTKHPQFGRQFKFSWYEIVQPKTTDGIYRYLVRVAKWVGPAVGAALVDTYGEQTLEILKADPARVAAEINGITAERAAEIQQSLKNYEVVEGALVAMEQIFSKVAGLRRSLAMDMVRRFAADALQKLQDNPYILTRIRGTGFVSADQVAMVMGYGKDSINRQAAAIEHVIHEEMHSSGHVWVELKAMAEKVKGLIGMPADLGLAKLEKEGSVVVLDGHVAEAGADGDETDIARRVCELVGVEAF